MKPKTPTLNFLLALLMAITTIGFTSCTNDDDDLGSDVYQGSIKGIYDDDLRAGYPSFIIEVSNLPKNTKTEIKKKDLLIVALADFPDIDFKVNQKISFQIISSERRGSYPELSIYTSVPYDWICKITLLKLN